METSYTIKRVKKRDGSVILFDENKIKDAISKAFKASAEGTEEDSKKLTAKVNGYLDIIFDSGATPTVESIQDLVEKVLIENNLAKTAKSYILYRKQHGDLRDTKELMFNVEETMDGYLKQSDWRVQENSNMNYSVSGLLMHTAGSVISHYTLNKVYPKEIGMAHIQGDMHIHDLSMGIAGYCAGWSLRQLLEEGFNGVAGKTDSKPPKHLSSALWQMINFLGTLQNEWAGAQAFSSFDTYLAPYIKVDNLSYESVKQSLQGFIFNLNVPTRWGGQTPFSNITLDWVVPEDMKEKRPVIGGKRVDFTYADCQKELDIINKAFIEIMTEGDASGRIFTFPIPTYNVTKDFDWESENAKSLFEMTAKYGIPYFQNFINSSLDPSDVRSMCCRLQMDLRELKARGGGLFGAAEMTGSVGVVTINLPRIGYLSESEEEFFARLRKVMDMAKDSLEIKRKVVISNMDKGLFPYSKRYLGSLNNHFSTIGLVGMNEALLNFFDDKTSITTEKGRNFALKVLDFMRDVMTQFQEETGNMYNLEASPAEGTSYRLARTDKKMFSDIITQGTNEPYYTNSSQLPVGFTSDIFEALSLQDDLQSKYTGGTVLHGFLGERISDWETCLKLVKRIAYNFKLPYFTITPTFSICPEHGYIPGEHFTCPICAQDTKVETTENGKVVELTAENKTK